MRIFVINGSPKGAKSNTYRMTAAFLAGMDRVTAQEIREITVSRMDIKPCLGCFSCWNKTPGQCCIRDDMAQVLENMLWADIIIWSFPLYYFSVPGGLKTLMDRQLPLVLPFMESDAESGGHPTRFDMSGKRHVVISTCGFYTAEGNYSGVNAMFDHFCGAGNYTPIYCGQGELFRVKELSQRTGEYLSWVTDAGEEYLSGGITPETRERLSQLLYPRAVFEAMADASWGVEKSGERADEALTFTRQMAALYNPKAYPGKETVLEMYYTDENKRYQILLGPERSTVLTENFHTPTTVIETPYTVWQTIAAGEISGEEAMMQGKYRVRGDFDLMLHWDRYFGPEQEQAASSQPQQKTDMNAMLIPWIAFWIAGAIHPQWGIVLTLAVCALVPLLYLKNRRTLYDVLSTGLVALFAGCLVFLPQRIVIPASYLAFGIMWAASCFCKLPLTAHYSVNDYGADMIHNPLFLKTNRILTACWGVLYLLTPIWTWFLMGSALSSWTGAINSVLPLLMGVFTAWFQKWYPAKIARGS